MQQQGINANVMSLGGIAIAIGAMVDAAIVMIENAQALKRLIESMKPSSTKGIYIRTLTLSATMTPGISVAA